MYILRAEIVTIFGFGFTKRDALSSVYKISMVNTSSIADGIFNILKHSHYIGPSLHIAVSTGNIERVQELIQHNPSLKDQTDEKGWIPLHVGCSSGQLECVKLIAVSGGNLEQETPTGYTSMHLAAMNGHVNCMMVST